MKTVSTKLDKHDFGRFQEMCNHDGQCVSEGLRELIKMGIESYEEGLEFENENSQERIEEKESKIMAHGKILDDFGNVIGTF